MFKEPLIKCTIGRRAALCPRSTLTYLPDKLRVSLRDVLPDADRWIRLDTRL